MNLWRELFGRPQRAVGSAQIPIPRVLYKYVPVDRCHHWLQERTVGFAALELLNDPYEGVILSLPHTGAGVTRIWEDRPVVKYRIGNMFDYGVNPDYDPNGRDRRLLAESRLNHEIDSRRAEALRKIAGCRILSLSRTPDNMVMWAHYASDSRGLCIGIDWAKANLLSGHGAPAEGAPKPTSLCVRYEDHPFQSRFERNEDPIHYALGRKHADWAYEREVRILRHESDFARKAGRNEKVGILDLRPDAVTEIVLGAKPDPRVRALLAAELGTFENAKVLQLEINSSGYNSRLREVGVP